MVAGPGRGTTPAKNEKRKKRRGKNGEGEKVEKTGGRVEVKSVKVEMMRKWDEKFGVRR